MGNPQRVALITGSSRGIGKAVAIALQEKGWQLFIVSRDSQRLQSVVSGMPAVIGSLAVDLGAGQSAASKVLAAFQAVASSLDMLVLDAGIFIEGALGDVSPSSFAQNMAVNLDANLYLSQAFIPLLRATPAPRIVIVGSTAAYESYPLVPTYGIAKWALRGLAINLRAELRNENIGVSFVSPGGTLTDMWAGVPLEPHRLLEPEDVAKLIAVLPDLSPQAVVDELIVRPMLGDIHE